MISNIILAIFLMIMVFCIFLLFRNSRTYYVRIYMLHNGGYDKLPSADEMFYDFTKPMTVKYWSKWVENK